MSCISKEKDIAYIQCVDPGEPYTMKIVDILGTRPEIIKTSPIIRESERQGLDYFILHTGQYYSYNLDKIFFEELELPKPKCNLDVGAGTHAEETGKMPILEKLYLYVKN